MNIKLCIEDDEIKNYALKTTNLKKKKLK